MAETTSNIEFAHRIHEQGHSHGGGPQSHRQEWIEIIEAVVLAAVAVLTAWSGYQAAKWDAESAESYAAASATTVQAQEQQTLAGQDHLYDVITFDSWIEARHRGEKDIAAVFERRFRPEYTVAYEAWIQTDPFHNPKAPPGPSFMPEYRSARLGRARELSAEARKQFERGVATRQTGDEYVRITVFLATVLLLTALAQRFKILGVRVGLLAVASVMLGFALYLIARFPRA
jgi:hypothetical protein